ncbi:helix-turn-helix transcriptional regulator [Streptomyces sp. NPDC001553]|uniref:helix-turn-helix domain-containing protein n=1 Tax=Streptomyces sp. NPDC001553 TaxID=3154385 RepID=UPI00332663AC
MADHPGHRIAARRQSRRMTQRDLAVAAHLSLGMIRHIEQGTRAPSPSALESIAAALGVDPARLDPGFAGTAHRVHATLPSISAAIAGYGIRLDPPARRREEPRREVRTASSQPRAQLTSSMPSCSPRYSTTAHGTSSGSSGRNRPM